ncbi:MAG TPA: hypothetical protein VGE67_15855 [Haloferula sp.]
MKTIFLASTLLLFLVSCSPRLAVERYGFPYSQMGTKLIPFRLPLPEGAPIPLEDLALSLPIFEGPPGTTSEPSGPVYLNGRRTWLLEGDGAQVTVRVDRLTQEKVVPNRIKVTLGPKSLYAPGELWIYTLEQRKDGWKKLSAETQRMRP